MNNAKPLFLWAMGVLVLCLTTCKKDIAPEPCNNPLDPNCVNYHPCNGVQPVTADFDMWYYSNFTGKLIEEDSVFPPGAILFKAKLNNAAYVWLLGKDTERVQSDYRLFNRKVGDPNDSSIYGTYYNSLTVNKTPNKNCYPNDAPSAKLTRSITIKRPSQLLTSGQFRVLFDGYADSNIIQIQSWEPNFKNKPNFDREYSSSRIFIGFKDVRDTAVMDDANSGFWYLDKTIYLGQSSINQPYSGKISVDPKTLTIEGNYKITKFLPNGTELEKQHHFKGKKL